MTEPSTNSTVARGLLKAFVEEGLLETIADYHTELLESDYAFHIKECIWADLDGVESYELNILELWNADLRDKLCSRCGSDYVFIAPNGGFFNGLNALIKHVKERPRVAYNYDRDPTSLRDLNNMQALVDIRLSFLNAMTADGPWSPGKECDTKKMQEVSARLQRLREQPALREEAVKLSIDIVARCSELNLSTMSEAVFKATGGDALMEAHRAAIRDHWAGVKEHVITDFENLYYHRGFENTQERALVSFIERAWGRPYGCVPLVVHEALRSITGADDDWVALVDGMVSDEVLEIIATLGDECETLQEAYELAVRV